MKVCRCARDFCLAPFVLALLLRRDDEPGFRAARWLFRACFAFWVTRAIRLSLLVPSGGGGWKLQPIIAPRKIAGNAASAARRDYKKAAGQRGAFPPPRKQPPSPPL